MLLRAVRQGALKLANAVFDLTTIRSGIERFSCAGVSNQQVGRRRHGPQEEITAS